MNSPRLGAFQGHWRTTVTNHPNRSKPALDKLCRQVMTKLEAREIRLKFNGDAWWAYAMPSLETVRNRVLANPKLEGRSVHVVNAEIDREAEKVIGEGKKGKTPEEAIAALIA